MKQRILQHDAAALREASAAFAPPPAVAPAAAAKP
jgi:hypothetical protein